MVVIGFLNLFGNAQVGKFDDSFIGNHHICRFDVAMYDVMLGGNFQGIRDGNNNLNGILNIDTAILLDDLHDVTPADVFQHDIVTILAIVFSGIHDSHDVVMLDFCGKFSLPHETFRILRVGNINPAR